MNLGDLASYEMCVSSLLFTVLLRDRVPAQGMGMAGHTTLDAGQMKLTAAYLITPRRRKPHAMLGHRSLQSGAGGTSRGWQHVMVFEYFVGWLGVELSAQG